MFSDILPTLKITDQVRQLSNITSDQVKALLQKSTWTPNDFPALISPAAKIHLETMAQHAHRLTVQRFGKTIQLFIPMYLSNLCYNTCTYCGFSIHNKYKRIVLTPEQILNEGHLLRNKGFRHILLLTGEAEDRAGVDYIAQAVRILSPVMSSIGIEVQPMTAENYEKLIAAGTDSLTLFQETYDEEAYAKYHLAGKKRNFKNRLNAVEYGAEAGFYRITLGALLGLTDWRFEALAMAAHLAYLQHRFWQIKYAISYPRIQDMVGEFSVENPVSDSDLIQYIAAFRLCFPDLGIVSSTRESAQFRDSVLPIGITHMSAESNTAPGGYSGVESEKQFETADHRPLSEIQRVLVSKGYDPVMKDWINIGQIDQR